MRKAIIAWSAAGWLALSVGMGSAQTSPPKSSVPLNITQDTLEDTPLLAARQSLLVARSRILEQKYSAAIPALLTAAEALAYFEQEEPGSNGRDAGYLRQEIKNYANDVQTDHQDAVIRIDDWISRLKQWQ